MAVSASELEVIVTAKDEASATLKKMSDEFKRMGGDVEALRKSTDSLSEGVTSSSAAFNSGGIAIGAWAAAAVAAAAAVTAVVGTIKLIGTAFDFLKGAVAEAGAEETGIRRLGASVSATGADWAEASAEIENYIQVQMRRGAIDDASARDAISRATMITGSYKTALSLLPLAMDLSAAKGMDLVSAMDLIGRVASGNIDMLKRYGIMLREGATATEALTAMQKAFAGQSEAFAAGYEGAMARYGAATGDLRETVGGPFKDMMTSVLNSLADLAVQAGPYMAAFAEGIRGGLNSLAQLAANAFYWGANIVSQFAAGLGSGTSYIASVLNSIGDMISSWLSPGSPPKLLPELDTWGEAAAQVYLDAFGKATPVGGMAGLAKQFAPMGELTRDPRFAEQIMAHERFVENLGKRSSDKKKSRDKKDRSAQAANAKAAEMEAKRLHDAQLQYELSTADAAGQVAIMTRELGNVSEGTAEYFNILTRLVGLNKQAANEEKRLNDARLQWELAQAGKAGQIKIYQRELAKTTEGTLEWYDIATKIIQLQKSGGGGGAGALAGMLKPLKDLELPKIALPKINWEDAWGYNEWGDPVKLPGLKTKLNAMGKELMALVIEGMKAVPGALADALLSLSDDLVTWSTSADVETAAKGAGKAIGTGIIDNIKALLGSDEAAATLAAGLSAGLTKMVTNSQVIISTLSANLVGGLVEGIASGFGGVAAAKSIGDAVTAFIKLLAPILVPLRGLKGLLEDVVKAKIAMDKAFGKIAPPKYPETPDINPQGGIGSSPYGPAALEFPVMIAAPLPEDVRRSLVGPLGEGWEGAIDSITPDVITSAGTMALDFSNAFGPPISASGTGTGVQLGVNLVTGLRSQEGAIAAEVARIKELLKPIQGAAGASVSYSVPGYVPGFASGGDFWATKPQLIMVGEKGPERVTVTPRGKGTGANTINITIHAPGGDPRKVQRAVISGLAAAGVKA